MSSNVNKTLVLKNCELETSNVRQRNIMPKFVACTVAALAAKHPVVF